MEVENHAKEKAQCGSIENTAPWTKSSSCGQKRPQGTNNQQKRRAFSLSSYFFYPLHLI